MSFMTVFIASNVALARRSASSARVSMNGLSRKLSLAHAAPPGPPPR